MVVSQGHTTSQSLNLYVALALNTSLKLAFPLLFVPIAELSLPATSELKPKLGVRSGSGRKPGIRRVGLKAEIDTSPPLGSVKEAVSKRGLHQVGMWMHECSCWASFASFDCLGFLHISFIF